MVKASFELEEGGRREEVHVFTSACTDSVYFEWVDNVTGSTELTHKSLPLTQLQD